MKFLDPLTVAKLSRLQVRVRHVVEGTMAGLHASPYRGNSLEFAQHRAYSSGDELRHIDWKVYGRSDRFFVKQYQDETNLRAYLLLDASGSMRYAEEGRELKLTYASRLAAALSYLLLHQEDAVGLGVFDEAMRFFVPPHHQLSHLPLLVEKLESVEAGGETAVEEVLAGFAGLLRKRGLIILVSDLLSADPAAVIKALKSYRCRHHGVLVLQVLDPEELRFGFEGDRLLVPMEKGEPLFVEPSLVADEYRRLMERLIETYRTGFRRSGIAYHLVTTDTPIEKALAECLTQGR